MKERSRRTPGCAAESGSDWAEGEVGGVEDGFVRNSITDLHSWDNLECLRHDPFLMILSRAGMSTWFSRESASEEAIPELDYAKLDLDLPMARRRRRLRKVVADDVVMRDAEGKGVARMWIAMGVGELSEGSDGKWRESRSRWVLCCLFFFHRVILSNRWCAAPMI